MANNVVECIACGHVGATKLRGSTFITVVLLLCYIIPGIIYMAWRRGGSACSACGSGNVKLYIPRQKTQQTLSPPAPHAEHLNVQQVQCPDCREYIRYDARKCKHCGSMVGE